MLYEYVDMQRALFKSQRALSLAVPVGYNEYYLPCTAATECIPSAVFAPQSRATTPFL